MQCNECPTTTLPSTTSVAVAGGVHTGVVVGIAIAVFLFGLSIGFLLQFVIGAVFHWCRNRGSLKIDGGVKYEKQEDDLKIT